MAESAMKGPVFKRANHNLIIARGNYSDYIDDTHTLADTDTDTDGEYYLEEGDVDVESDSTDDEFAYGDNEVEEFKNEVRRILVRGLDRLASNLDVKIKMCEHFSSCGEVTYVLASNVGRSEGWAIVGIVGQGAIDKAKQLVVCQEHGWNINVEMVFPSLAERRERLHQQSISDRKKKKTTTSA